MNRTLVHELPVAFIKQTVLPAQVLHGYICSHGTYMMQAIAAGACLATFTACCSGHTAALHMCTLCTDDTHGHQLAANWLT